MKTRSSKLLAGVTAAGLSLAVAASPAFAADPVVSADVEPLMATTKGVDGYVPNTGSLGLKIKSAAEALPSCATDAWTLALRPVDFKGKVSTDLLEIAPFFADTQTLQVQDGAAMGGVMWTSKDVEKALTPAAAGVTSGKYEIAAVCVNDTGNVKEGTHEANATDHMPTAAVVADGAVMTSDWLPVEITVADKADDSKNSYTFGEGVSTPGWEKKDDVPVERTAPWAEGSADIWILEKDGAWHFEGSKGTGKREFSWREGAKTDVTMLKQYNWLGNSKMDLIERHANGKLTLQIDGVGAVQEIGSNWGAMTDLIPMGGSATGEKPFLLARHKSGDLYGYVWVPSLKRLQGIGIVGKRWNQMSAMFSVGNTFGDPKSDLLGINKTNATLYGFAGKGNGKIGESVRIGKGWSGFMAFTPGLVDKNKTSDLAGLRADGKIFLYGNNGKGFNAAKEMGGGVDYAAVRVIG